ncbi:ALP1-like protein isoform X1 [Tanacetum coccineum]
METSTGVQVNVGNINDMIVSTASVASIADLDVTSRNTTIEAKVIGVAGANNDLTVLNNSLLFEDLLDDIASVAPFEVNGVTFEKGKNVKQNGESGSGDSRVEPIKEEEEKAPEEERGSGDMAAATFLCKCSTLMGVRLSLLQHSSERRSRDLKKITVDDTRLQWML